MNKLKSDYEHYEIDSTTISIMIYKINEIVDWINIRERQMKRAVDVLERSADKLEKTKIESIEKFEKILDGMK